MKQVKSEATDKRGLLLDTARRDLNNGAIDSLIHASFKPRLQPSKNIMEQVKSLATDKRGPPFDTTRRDLIDGTIEIIIESFDISLLNMNKTTQNQNNSKIIEHMATDHLQTR